MERVSKEEIPQLLAQSIQPIIFTDNEKSDRFLDEFALLAVEIEKRKELAKQQAAAKKKGA